jgi:hypothetical protein
MTTKKISSLTPEQEARLPEYRDEALRIGLNTSPINFDKTVAVLKSIYENEGVPFPAGNVHYAESPKAATVIAKANGISNKSDFFKNIVYGNNDSFWLMFYKFFNDVCDIPLPQIKPLLELAYNGGWNYVDEKLVICIDRPIKLKFDEQKRLHCENGPAIEYKDGFASYSWHGVSVPDDWIKTKGFLTAEMALKEPNMERRRAACEILGWAKILDDLDSKVIDEDDDPEIGTLLEVNIPDIGKERFLKVRCGTGRTFALPVPPDMKTALDANAWTYDIDPKELLNLEFRT